MTSRVNRPALSSGSDRHSQALAGTCRQAFSWYRSHGIAALDISATLQYHAMCVELFMVSVIADVPRRIEWLQGHALSLSAWNQAVCHYAPIDFGYAHQVQSVGKQRCIADPSQKLG